MEQRRGWDRPADLWRTNAAYRQQLSKLTDLRLELVHEEKAQGDPTRRMDRSAVNASVSQGLGTNKVKARAAYIGAVEDHHYGTEYQRQIRREEVGIDWQVVRQLSLYGGVAMEQESRDVWTQDEQVLLQEVRLRWNPEKILGVSGGFSYDSRDEQTDASASRTRWFLRGDLNPIKEMSFFGQVRWDEFGRNDADGNSMQRDNKLTVEAGQNFQIDEKTRLTAEYGVVQDSRSQSREGTLIEHMLSVVVRTEF
jgi:hypothetical protein